MKNHTKILLWLLGGAIVTVVSVLPLISSHYFELATALIKNYPYATPLIIILFRFLGVVIAPIPGAPIMFASIAILPWWQAWLYNFIGTFSGTICAFFIARNFREPVVAHFAPLREIHTWQDSVSHRKQFWTFAVLRLSSLVAFDFVNYAAGLSKMSFRTYIFATLLVEIPVGFVFFYLGGVAIQYSFYLFAFFTFSAIATGLMMKYYMPKRAEKLQAGKVN